MKKIALFLFLHLPFLWVATSCGDNPTSSSSGTSSKMVEIKKNLERVISEVKSKQIELKVIPVSDQKTKEIFQLEFLKLGSEIMKLQQECESLDVSPGSKAEKELFVLLHSLKKEIEIFQLQGGALKMIGLN